MLTASAGHHSLGALRAAAVVAVRRGAGLARAVQAAFGAGDAVAKADASPVTVGDLGVQAVVALSLRASLGGVSLLAEEDAASLLGGGPALIQRVVSAVNSAYPKAQARHDAALAAGGAGAVEPALAQLLSGGDSWTTADVAAAVATGGQAAAAGSSYFVLDPIDGTKGYVRGASEPGRGHQYCIGLAFVQHGTPVIGVLGCPALPFPRLLRGGEAPGGTPPPGTLFSAQAGQGATQEPLWEQPSAAPVSCATAADAEPARTVVCESFEAGHSDHALSAAIAQQLGIDSTACPSIRMDSMCKYGLIARGDGHVYLRFPRAGYVEWVWDHAAGLVVLSEAGGIVTDAHGRPLDFSRGAKLSENEGVVASASPALHARVLAAVEVARAPR